MDAKRHVHVQLEETDSIAIVIPRERKLTQEEVYKELRGPIEYDAQVDAERTRCCAGGHPDAEDQDPSSEEEEVRVEKGNQDTEPWP